MFDCASLNQHSVNSPALTRPRCYNGIAGIGLDGGPLVDDVTLNEVGVGGVALDIDDFYLGDGIGLAIHHIGIIRGEHPHLDVGALGAVFLETHGPDFSELFLSTNLELTLATT